MPIYEYECKSCGHRFELLQKLSDDASGIECPECRSENTGRCYSTFSSGSSNSSKSPVSSGHSAPGHS